MRLARIGLHPELPDKRQQQHRQHYPEERLPKRVAAEAHQPEQQQIAAARQPEQGRVGEQTSRDAAGERAVRQKWNSVGATIRPMVQSDPTQAVTASE